MHSLTPAQFEIVFERMHRLNDEEDFIIKLTEAPHYRRFVIQKEQSDFGAESDQVRDRVQRILARPRGVNGAVGMSPQAINSGKGFMFVDHLGNICPSGFLPIIAGNVRERSIVDVYRNAEIFRQLRDSALLKGSCGRCEFAQMCGGSRARAYAVTSDPQASDPFCGYAPRARA